jgi:2-polyprenyl-3-methyl-5-hydroxy-6-metoxy-1,4-benzoquinol methylase
VKPGKTLDVGCGLGNYAKYLASNGFDVLGVDFSQKAVETNQNKYHKENLKFKTCDALNLKSLDTKFDFVLDISLFHHIKPEDRKKYAESLASVTKSGSKVLVCCFSDSNEIFEGKSELYGLETNTVMYALSKEEITKTFENQFEITELREFEFGKLTKFKQSGTKQRNLIFMMKK